jgi:uncharacterized membrane protein
MESGRLEAFTDGVIAVIITIMVLELKAPHAPSFEALLQSWPLFVSYVLSFIYVGIYWNNHHHLLSLPKVVNGKIMWANLFFLFWLSLFPFTTSWLAEATPIPQPIPTAVYGFVLLMAALSWIPLLRFLISANGGPTGELANAVRSKWKEYGSVVIYAVAILAALFLSPIVACVLYAAVAAMWFVPDRRIEKKVVEES